MTHESPVHPGHAAPNGDHTPDLTDSGSVNGFSAKLSALPPNAVRTPAADSPQTPVSSHPVPDVKIDIDCQEQESDVRHEPIHIKPIDHDVDMPGPVNGSAPDLDVHMDDVSVSHTPTALAPDASMATVADDERPAKRARIDADKASIAHSPTPPPASAAVSEFATPPPPSAATATTVVPHPSALPPTLNTAQFRFCQSTVRSLKKLKDASPFLRPVDFIGLNIPHYPSVIKQPMDFSTIERKLASSNPSKPDPNPQNPRYYHAEEFVADVRLIFSNTTTFNGPEHAVSLMGKRVMEVFDKQIKHLPPAAESKPPVVKKIATPPPPPPAPVPVKKVAARRASTSLPVIRRNDQNESVGRPKREIHPPPPKDLPYAEAPKKHKKGKRAKDDGTAEQLRYCAKILQDLHKKQHYEIAHHFYEPVDWVKLEIPAYPKIVKKPMDMQTMRKKLEAHEYPNAQKFHDDFKLMIRNCFSFNPSGTLVNMAGIELQRMFDEKWRNLPALHPAEVSDDDDDDEEDEEELERQRTIALMESQIESMRGDLEALKGGVKPPKEKKKKEKKEKPPVASTSKAPPKQPKAISKKSGGGKKKAAIADDDVLTFEQKKDLSESITKLDGPKLERVIQIIHEGVPEIRDSTEEIELEIDLLPAAVLIKLYNFVIRPLRQPAASKRARTGKGTGTGGLKRKSMDEDAEAEKIRQLEQRMLLFDQGAGGAAAISTARRDDDSESSDSSSDESSGSESD